MTLLLNFYFFFDFWLNSIFKEWFFFENTYKYLFILFFFFFSLSSVVIFTTSNPIYSILNLIFVFFLSFCLLPSLNIEFLAIISLLIYIGAIAVSFPFIIMMLNFKIINFNINFYNYIPFYIIFFFFSLFFFNYYFLEFNINFYINFSIKYWDWTIFIYSFTNIKIIGLLLYNYFSNLIIFIAFLLSFTLLSTIFLISEFEKKKKIQIIENLKNNIILKF